MAREVILQPGELFFGKEDVVLKTVLGSCIAITLWHPEQKMGGTRIQLRSATLAYAA